MVIGMSVLKLAGLRTKDHSLTRLPMRGVDAGLLLQATLILDTQLKETPRDNGLRLLLVQLHLLLGSASIAYQLWLPMDVKRTIQDALSPLFFDRISTLSPGLFHGPRPLMEPLRAHYRNTLRDECPLKMWDAFLSGSYTSILGMNEYDSTLRRSCTLMMSMVEESRATRAFGGKGDGDIADQQLACECYRSLQPAPRLTVTRENHGQHNPCPPNRLRFLPQPREPPRSSHPRLCPPRTRPLGNTSCPSQTSR